jgi:hypothetical protein
MMPLTHDDMVVVTQKHGGHDDGDGRPRWEYPRPGFDLEASKAIAEEIIALAVSPLPLDLHRVRWAALASTPGPIGCRYHEQPG